MALEALIELSRRYGRNPDFVVGGGGNTSFKETADKNGADLYVKASGTALESIDAQGFVRMDLDAVRRVLAGHFPDNPAMRESQVLVALLAARRACQNARPSVETILHALFPYAYVVHTHPAFINGLLCAVDAQRCTAELFGDQALFVPYTTPGFILSKTIADIFAAYGKKDIKIPRIIFLQNHGVFVAADTVSDIDALHDTIFKTIASRISEKKDEESFARTVPLYSDGAIEACIHSIKTCSRNAFVRYANNKKITQFLASELDFAPLSGSFTPDHIVYSGAKPLFVDIDFEAAEAEIEFSQAWNNFLTAEKYMPRIIAVRNLGVFSTGTLEKSAIMAEKLFFDAVEIASNTVFWGGYTHMHHNDVEFIKKWEVEQYRSSISLGEK